MISGTSQSFETTDGLKHHFETVIGFWFVLHVHHSTCTSFSRARVDSENLSSIGALDSTRIFHFILFIHYFQKENRGFLMST